MMAADSGLRASLLAPTDPDVQSLANTTQPVRWYYIMDQSTQRWYIVYPPTSSVLMLDRVDQATSFGVYWKPINNYAAGSSLSTQSYPDARVNFSTVTLSPDGRTVSFGSAVTSNADPDVQVLANSVQPVRWFFIMNAPTSLWYIVAPTSRAVLQLHHVDRAASFGIYWKPVNNWVASSSASTAGFADAGNQFTSLTVTADGGTVLFGAATGQAGQVSLTAFPTTLYSGQTTALTWSSSNVTSCNAPWVANSSTSGSVSVIPSGTTTYSITCSGAGGSFSASVVVTVLQAGSLALSINGLPSGIAGNVTMTGPNSYTGQINFTVTLGSLAAGTYTIAASPVTAGGVTYAPSPTSQQQTVVAGVTVSAGVSYSTGTAPSIALSATPSTISQGQTSSLSWNAGNATSCTAGWTGSMSTSGSQVVAPTVTTTYAMTCSGSGGSKSTSVVVTVNPSSNPTLGGMSTSPGTIAVGQSFLFTLTGSNINPTNVQVVFTGPGCPTTTSCVVPNGVLTTRTTGMVVGPALLNSTGTFSVQVQNGGGTLSNSVSVTVGGASDHFTWPTDPGNSSNGFFGTCGDWVGDPAGCYWLSTGGWRDVQPFQLHWYVNGTTEYGYHLGADWNLGSGSNDANLPVYAIADGTVASVQANVAGWGNVLFVTHVTSFGTYTSMYAHVNWNTTGPPAPGSWVTKGSQIARIGNGGGLYPYHLHLELRVGTNTFVGKGYTDKSRVAPEGQVNPNVFIAGHR
jgi:murein DD-endopeptidase MepM/ murein hydrolase activator NlpD